MTELELPVVTRSATAKQLGSLRASGMVPGVVYGQGKPATLLQVESKLLDKVFHQAGSSRLVKLSIDKAAPQNVLFHDVQIDPITRQTLHFDLFTVKMDEKIKTEVPLHFTEEAPAVHAYSAILVKNLEAIEVEALPAHLPENIEVNLSSLAEIGDAIHVRDLKVDDDVEILVDPEELVVKVDPPRSEEELAELEEEVEEDAEAKVESEHGAEEAEEGTEGETAEAADTEDQTKEAPQKKEDQ